MTDTQVSTNSGSFTVKEDGPIPIHYPRSSAPESEEKPFLEQSFTNKVHSELDGYV